MWHINGDFVGATGTARVALRSYILLNNINVRYFAIQGTKIIPIFAPLNNQKEVMKHIKIVFAVMLVFTLCTAFTMKSHKPVYAFGVAASFNDSVVYCTEIQVLDSTALDKNGFLPKRDLYSYQLKNYLEYDLKKPDYTCMIYFSENKKKLEKEAVKVKAKYKKSTMVLQAITSDKFSFKKPEE